MKKLKYSLEWSENVVKKLFKAHTRAFNFLMLNCGFSYGDAVIMLATASKEFYVLREMLKYLDKVFYGKESDTERVPDEGTTIRLLSLFKARIRQMGLDRGVSPLTATQSWLNFEEPLNSGVDLGVAPPESIPSMASPPARAEGGGLE